MCLIIDGKANKKPPQKVKVCYKWFFIDSKGRLTSPFYPVKGITEAGYYKSNRSSTTLTRAEIREGVVEKGIHVLTKLDIERGWRGDSHVLLRVYCHPEDFVSYGCNGEAVYTQVEIRSLKPIFRRVYVS